MNTTDLAKLIAADHDLTVANGKSIVEAVFSAITQAAVAGEEIVILGFGKFKVKHKEAREGRNPATGEPIEIAASRKLGFAAAKALKEKLNP